MGTELKPNSKDKSTTVTAELQAEVSEPTPKKETFLCLCLKTSIWVNLLCLFPNSYANILILNCPDNPHKSFHLQASIPVVLMKGEGLGMLT